MIDILIPVLGRPQNALPVVNSIEATTTVDHSILFLCSEGDDEQIKACEKTGARIIVADFGVNYQYGVKMNHGYRATDRKWILMGADDLEFEKGWDVIALHTAEQTGKSVIGTNDCANPNVLRGEFSTHPLITRLYIETRGACMDGPGHLCHEGYDHNYTDLEICQVAQARAEWVFCPESRVCHRHPDWGFGEKDQTYHKGFRQFRRDRKLFIKRSKTFR